MSDLAWCQLIEEFAEARGIAVGEVLRRLHKGDPEHATYAQFLAGNRRDVEAVLERIMAETADG